MPLIKSLKLVNIKKNYYYLKFYLCEISSEKINIKAKTTEKLGVIGKEKAIACEVIASVYGYTK